MYILTVKTSAKDRQFLLDNKETIVIVFPPDEGYSYSVACVSFLPFGDENTVIFDDNWIAYASSQIIQYNKTIVMNITQQVKHGNNYVFNGIHFAGNGPAYADEVYGLLNASANNLTCGLGQEISVNNVNNQALPINICSTPVQQTTYFIPTTKIWIFVATAIDTSMIIPTQMLTPINKQPFGTVQVNDTFTVGNYLEIDLTQTSTVIFDSSINAFKMLHNV